MNTLQSSWNYNNGLYNIIFNTRYIAYGVKESILQLCRPFFLSVLAEAVNDELERQVGIEVGWEVCLDIFVVHGDGVAPALGRKEEELGAEVLWWTREPAGHTLPVKAANIVVTDLVSPF